MAKGENVELSTVEVRPKSGSGNDSITDGIVPPQWPSQPRPLTAAPVAEHTLDVFDGILCAIPLLLIAKIALILVAFRKDRGATGYFADTASSMTVYLIKFNHQLATLFTICFVLIITTLVRRLALFRAQKSATIGELELFQAAISLPGTLWVIWSLRVFTLSSFGLLFVWVWYYLGSQAGLSEYALHESGSFFKFPIAYANYNKPSMFYNRSLDEISPIALNNVNSNFVAFTQYGDTMGGFNEAIVSDIYGTVLTPMWVGSDSTQWRDVSEASENYYASYFGTTIFSYAPNSYVHENLLVGDFTYNHSYFNFECQPLVKHALHDFPADHLPGAQISFEFSNSSAPDSLTENDPPTSVNFWAVFTNAAWKSKCEISRVEVEVQAHCTANTCAAQKMRLSQPGVSSYSRTNFDDAQFRKLFFEQWLLSNGPPTISGAIQNVVASNVLLQTAPPEWDAADWDPVQAGIDAALTLTQLVNSYYDASVSYTGAPIHADDTVLQDVLLGIRTHPQYSTSDMDGAQYDPQYRISIPWIVLDFIACIILLAAAIIAFWLRKKTLAPDIFGYVSSLTRDNPYLNLPTAGSAMSGFQRARAMRGVRVRIADVGGSEDVGRIGLAPADDAQHVSEMRELSLNRQYV